MLWDAVKNGERLGGGPQYRAFAADSTAPQSCESVTSGDEACGLVWAGASAKAPDGISTPERVGLRVREVANEPQKAHKAWAKAVDGQHYGGPYHAPAMNARVVNSFRCRIDSAPLPYFPTAATPGEPAMRHRAEVCGSEPIVPWTDVLLIDDNLDLIGP